MAAPIYDRRPAPQRPEPTPQPEPTPEQNNKATAMDLATTFESEDVFSAIDSGAFGVAISTTQNSFQELPLYKGYGFEYLGSQTRRRRTNPGSTPFDKYTFDSTRFQFGDSGVLSAEGNIRLNAVEVRQGYYSDVSDDDELVNFGVVEYYFDYKVGEKRSDGSPIYRQCILTANTDKTFVDTGYEMYCDYKAPSDQVSLWQASIELATMFNLDIDAIPSAYDEVAAAAAEASAE